MVLALPEPIQATLARFDGSSDPFEEEEVSFALQNAIKGPSSIDEVQRKGAFAEVSAFGYMPPLTGDSSIWGTYFGPMATAIRNDGTELYTPDIHQADASIIEHWVARAGTAHHPILRARYADLVWDFARLVTNERPEVRNAQISVDAYLEAVEHNCYASSYQAAGFVSRALSLAISLNDKARIHRAKDAIFRLHQILSDAAGGGVLWLPFDLLYGAKTVDLSASEQAKIIADLEAVLRETSNRATSTAFDPWTAQGAAERLELHYRKVHQSDDIGRVIRVYGNAFESIAAQAEPMLATAWLQPVYEKYRTAGLPDDARRVLLALEQYGKGAQASMKEVRIPIEIDGEEFRRTVEAITEGGLNHALKCISHGFLPREQDIRDLNEEVRRAAPLVSLIPMTKFSFGHAAAVIGPQDRDPMGRLIYQMAQTLAFHVPWLAATFDRLSQRYAFSAEDLTDVLLQSPLFDPQRKGVLAEGIAAWRSGDDVKAIHVLVPQVEHAVRTMISQLGLPTTTRGRASGTLQARALGEMLFDEAARSRLDPNVRLYLLALFADPRGLNLRNAVAHGLLEHWQMTRSTSDRIVHALLVLSALQPMSPKGTGCDQSVT